MKICFIVALLMLCGDVFAGAQVGKVKSVVARDDGLHFVFLEGAAATGKPACAKNSYWMIRDENSTAGKSQLSILLAAHVSGKTISIEGKNTCTRWGDGEDISAVLLLQ